MDTVQAYLDSFSRHNWGESDEEDDPVRFAMVGLGWWTCDEGIPAVERSQPPRKWENSETIEM